MQCDQRRFIADAIALVASGGAAVAEEMLGGRQDMLRPEKIGRLAPPLQSLDHRRSEAGDQRRILAIAFISAAPAIIAGNGDCRGEGPVDAGDGDFGGGRFADTPHQIGIAGRTEPDIMREQRRADDIIMAVHRVGRP